MNTLKNIRKRIGVTQSELAAGIGLTQGNISHYEKGQTVPPDVAARIIRFAGSLGTTLSFNDLYEQTRESAHD